MDTSRTATLVQLRKAYERSFRDYMKACRGGYALLAAVTDLPLSEITQRQMLAQRRKEVDAHTAYTGTRTKLWKFLTANSPRQTEKSESESLDADAGSSLGA